MDLFVFCAVLAAAACHAGWNAMLKLKLAPILALSLVSVGCGIVVAPLLPFVGWPNAASWPYIFASLAIHLVYYAALGETYRTGDLGLVYPIARGTAPLLTAVGATVIVGQYLGPAGWLGVAVLAAGIIILSMRGGSAGQPANIQSIGFALLTAAAISSYTLIDGVGAKVAGSPHAYAGWLFLIDGFMMTAFALWRFPVEFKSALRTDWKLVLVGGGLSAAGYWIAIWAMTVAPIALVAALRETSVLFAALISVALLREPILPVRMFAAAMVVAGIMLIRMP
jgi:drug/metabolite transporter (DMT)-like permease